VAADRVLEKERNTVVKVESAGLPPMVAYKPVRNTSIQRTIGGLTRGTSYRMGGPSVDYYYEHRLDFPDCSCPVRLYVSDNHHRHHKPNTASWHDRCH
jgi:hypothetical protein